MKDEPEELKDVFYCDFEYWDRKLKMIRKCGKRAVFHAGKNKHVCEEHVQKKNAKLIKAAVKE